MQSSYYQLSASGGKAMGAELSHSRSISVETGAGFPQPAGYLFVPVPVLPDQS